MKLLSVVEDIKENLSGQQIARTLDQFYYEAVKCIINTSSLYEELLAELLVAFFDSKKRRYTALLREDCNSSLFTLLFNKDVNMAQKTGVERNLVNLAVDKYLKIGESYKALYIESIVAPLDEQMLLRADMQNLLDENSVYDTNFLCSYSNASAAFDLAITFRNMIISKYIRYIHNMAKRAGRATSIALDKEDLCANMLLAGVKALDRFRDTHGTPTSTIGWWAFDATTRPEHAHETGLALSVPSAERKKVGASQAPIINIAENIEDHIDLSNNEVTHEQHLINTQQADTLVQIAYAVDRHKMALLLLRMPYFLSDQQKKSLLS